MDQQEYVISILSMHKDGSPPKVYQGKNVKALQQFLDAKLTGTGTIRFNLFPTSVSAAYCSISSSGYDHSSP